MALRHRPFTEADAKEVADWQYEPPYDIYNFGGWEKALAGGSGLPRPEIRGQAFCALEWDGSFAGFSALRSRIPGTAECRVRAVGQGAGEGIDGSDRRGWAARCPHLPLRLEVRTFNQRARKQYEAAEFHAVRQYERPTLPGWLNFFRWNGPLTERDTLHSGSVSLLLSFHHTCPSTNRQAAVAATEPSAAAVVSWRRVLVRQSPAVKTPGVLVRQSSPATI